jgi:hypothetical protein
MLAALIPAFGELAFMLLRTAGLVLFWLVFFSTYVTVTAATSATTARRLSPLELARRFALTYGQIAIGFTSLIT